MVLHPLADLLPDWLGAPDRKGLRELLGWAARSTGLDEPAPSEWLGDSRVLAGAGKDQLAARATVWDLTGKAPQAFVARLATSLDMADRRWRLQDYLRWFVGSQAVEHLIHSLQRPREDALALGQALGELGLLVQVMQKHPFLDQALYYQAGLVRRAGPRRRPAGAAPHRAVELDRARDPWPPLHRRPFLLPLARGSRSWRNLTPAPVPTA